VVLEEGVPVFSFTFGVPDKTQISALKEAGIVLVGTATTVREGLVLEERGVDAVVGQGSEAGGHRGTFIGYFESARDRGRWDHGWAQPRRGAHARRRRGPDGDRIPPPPGERDTPKVQRSRARGAVGRDEPNPRVLRQAARGIRNRFTEEMDQQEVPAYPGQNAFTKDIRAAAAKEDRIGFLSLWPGGRPRASSTGGGGRREHGKRSSTKAVGYRPSAILTIRRPLTATAR
jgi:nitronate monooxygenase